jgi:hypothetical protein
MAYTAYDLGCLEAYGFCTHHLALGCAMHSLNTGASSVGSMAMRFCEMKIDFFKARFRFVMATGHGSSSEGRAASAIDIAEPFCKTGFSRSR